MGKCVLLGEETRGGSERNWGPQFLPQTRSLKYVCPELGPACIGPGGGTAHPPAYGVSPEQEEGPPWVRFFLGPFSPWRVGALRLLLPRPPPLGRLGGGR